MKQTVMLIDDSITIHRVIDLSVDKDRIEIIKAFSREEAAMLLKSTDPAVILLDNKLDGVVLADYVAELKTLTSGSAVVLLVGAFDQFTEKHLGATGADDFIVKPFDPDTLDATLTPYFSGSAPASAAETPTRLAEGSAASAASEAMDYAETSSFDSVDDSGSRGFSPEDFDVSPEALEQASMDYGLAGSAGAEADTASEMEQEKKNKFDGYFDGPEADEDIDADLPDLDSFDPDADPAAASPDDAFGTGDDAFVPPPEDDDVNFDTGGLDDFTSDAPADDMSLDAPDVGTGDDAFTPPPADDDIDFGDEAPADDMSLDAPDVGTGDDAFTPPPADDDIDFGNEAPADDMSLDAPDVGTGDDAFTPPPADDDIDFGNEPDSLTFDTPDVDMPTTEELVADEPSIDIPDDLAADEFPEDDAMGGMPEPFADEEDLASSEFDAPEPTPDMFAGSDDDDALDGLFGKLDAEAPAVEPEDTDEFSTDELSAEAPAFDEEPELDLGDTSLDAPDVGTGDDAFVPPMIEDEPEGPSLDDEAAPPVEDITDDMAETAFDEPLVSDTTLTGDMIDEFGISTGGVQFDLDAPAEAVDDQITSDEDFDGEELDEPLVEDEPSGILSDEPESAEEAAEDLIDSARDEFTLPDEPASESEDDFTESLADEEPEPSFTLDAPDEPVEESGFEAEPVDESASAEDDELLSFFDADLQSDDDSALEESLQEAAMPDLDEAAAEDPLALDEPIGDDSDLDFDAPDTAAVAPDELLEEVEETLDEAVSELEAEAEAAGDDFAIEDDAFPGESLTEDDFDEPLDITSEADAFALPDEDAPADARADMEELTAFADTPELPDDEPIGDDAFALPDEPVEAEAPLADDSPLDEAESFAEEPSMEEPDAEEELDFSMPEDIEAFDTDEVAAEAAPDAADFTFETPEQTEGVEPDFGDMDTSLDLDATPVEDELDAEMPPSMEEGPTVSADEKDAPAEEPDFDESAMEEPAMDEPEPAEEAESAEEAELDHEEATVQTAKDIVDGIAEDVRSQIDVQDAIRGSINMDVIEHAIRSSLKEDMVKDSVLKAINSDYVRTILQEALARQLETAMRDMVPDIAERLIIEEIQRIKKGE